MRVESFLRHAPLPPPAYPRQQRTVSQATLTRVRAQDQAAISARNVARMLGIGAQRVAELRDAGFIKEMHATGRGGVWFDQRNVEALANQIIAMAHPDAMQAPTVSLVHALRFRLPRGDGAVARLIRAVTRGEVNLFQPRGIPASRLGDLQVSSEGVAKFLATRKAPTLSLPEAATALGIKQEVVYALARSGRLHVTRGRGQLRTAERTTRASIAAFKREYVSAVELAKKLGTSPRRTIVLMGQRQVYPVIGPETDGCRQVFFRRLGLEGRMTDLDGDRARRPRSTVSRR